MLIPNILIWRLQVVNACRQTGACVVSKDQILGEAGVVIGKAAAAFFSVMHRCMEFHVGCFYSVLNFNHLTPYLKSLILLPIEQTAILREGFQDMMFHDLVRASTPAMLSIQGEASCVWKDILRRRQLQKAHKEGCCLQDTITWASAGA